MAEVLNRAEAEKIIEEHIESNAGTCIQCFRDHGLAIMVPCVARIEVARFLNKAGPC
ncbi:hypothetical protein AB0M43_33050 [Longispora sp. NPDC051575]|uniref:hypothetical protein n=1 Tax=Longispora sp. NPDC051575 TaxID=3154943 RepID=UPI00344AA780